MKRWLPRSRWGYVLLLAIVVGGGGVLWYAQRQPSPVPATSEGGTSTQAISTNPDDGRIRLLATGDFIAHDSVNAAAKQSDGSYNYVPLMDVFAPTFHGADIRFCNDPILNGGEALGIEGYPKFNSPTEFVDDMQKLGCNMVNTASNHSFDFTQNYIDASVDAWQKQPDMLAVVGQNKTQAEHDAVHVFSVKGVTFAFLAYTSYSNRPPQNSYGLNVFSQDFATKQIAEARKQGAQVIIVSMRWGTEYAEEVNALQKQQAQFLANQGVDVVLGHGPHVVQAATRLAGSDGHQTTVFYSLGNFLSSQIPAETLFNGIASIDFDVATKKITDISYSPIYMHYEWTAAQASAEQLDARHNLMLYPLDDHVTQAMIDSNQLKTTAAAQRERLQQTLNSMGLNIPLVSLDKI